MAAVSLVGIPKRILWCTSILRARLCGIDLQDGRMLATWSGMLVSTPALKKTRVYEWTSFSKIRVSEERATQSLTASGGFESFSVSRMPNKRTEGLELLQRRPRLFRDQASCKGMQCSCQPGTSTTQSMRWRAARSVSPIWKWLRTRICSSQSP